VSKKLIPRSSALLMIWCDSSGPVLAPKFMVPRQSLLTETPLRPRCV
jgi:hypothetical protein